MDAAIKAARKAGADVIVSDFPDPIGRDAVVQWPGGVNMQLYWHTTVPNYTAFQTVPENRVYVSADREAAFVKAFVPFSHGKVVSDVKQAPGIEIGPPNDTYHRIRIESTFGKMTVLVTDGHLLYPFGHETAGYEVPHLQDTLTKAKASGATLIVEPFKADGSRVGYTFKDVVLKPRVGLQLDIASGDSHPGDNRTGTFNPLFPNGYYFSLAGYTGYTNLIHVKPSITVTPIDKLSVLTAVGLQWRQTTQDAVYVQPNVPIAVTAGQGNRWTGCVSKFAPTMRLPRT